MSAAEDIFAEQCEQSLARVRAIAAACDLDGLQAGRDAYDREQERRLRDGEEPF